MPIKKTDLMRMRKIEEYEKSKTGKLQGKNMKNRMKNRILNFLAAHLGEFFTEDELREGLIATGGIEEAFLYLAIVREDLADQGLIEKIWCEKEERWYFGIKEK